MNQASLKAEIFTKCIAALQRNDPDTAEHLLNELTLSATDLAANALANKIRNQIKARKEAIPASATDIPEFANTVVIVTPVYNCVKYVDDTITSIINQKGNFALRYHVQDGGSTDGTVERLRSWESRLGDKKNLPGDATVEFSWKSEKDSNMYDAINRGFAHVFAGMDAARAEKSMMSWLNADDLLATNAILTATAFFAEHPDVHWITGLGAIMNAAGSIVNVSNEPAGYPQHSLALGLNDGRSLPFVQQEGTFWRNPVWQKACGLRPEVFRLAGDWDLWRRFAAITPLVVLQTVLGIYRRHPGQLSENIKGYYKDIDSMAGSLASVPTNLKKVGLRAIYDIQANIWHITEPALKETNALVPARMAPNAIESAFTQSTTTLPDTLPDGRPWPRISVVTASFNQGRYIAETIESVLSQGYPNVEHIIIDGGSTDETLQVIDRYRSQLAYVVSERDKGQSDALGKGFARATGDILCWLNSDDQFAPGALAAVAMAFATSQADIVSGICEVYQEGKLLHRHMTSCSNGALPLADMLDLDNGWNAGQFFYQPEVFFSRSLWEKAGAHVRVDCYYSMDYELWCRFALAGARLHVIGAPLARFRMHPEQKTADPSKFKAELLMVRDRFVSDNKIEMKPRRRPAARFDRTLKVAMVNDIGMRFGAGIAQGRLAAGIEMVGHHVEIFDMASRVDANGKVSEQKFIQEITGFEPDLVIFGNLHAANKESVTVIDALGKRYPSLWVTHDFWLITGRCAYPGSCTKYLTGCDASCPTPEQYPELAPNKIAAAWKRKRKLLEGKHAPVVVGNSAWSAKVVSDALTQADPQHENKIANIQLGAPVNLFRKLSRTAARAELGINPDHFVVAFSVSALSDERKGGKYLLDALRTMKVADLTLLVIGNLDKPLEIKGVNVVSLGYISDAATLVVALNAADVYVGPSTEETFGQVFIEAALAGVPSIGFDQTGVKDAIIEGVTGLRVACSAQALRKGILRLYHDRPLCKALGEWAHVYAANEFSLESSYRSLFNVWRQYGFVDEWQIPHKIGFVRTSRFVDDSLGEIVKWRGERGLSVLEGPYPPDWPITFRWCYGPETLLKINCGAGGRYKIALHYHNPLFDLMRVAVYINNEHKEDLVFHKTRVGGSNIVDIAVTTQAGWNNVKLMPDISKDTSSGDTRPLTFMLQDLELSKLEV